MSIILNRPEAKAQTINILKAALSLLVIDRLGQTEKGHVVEHIEWMTRQTEDMHVECRLETEPSDKETELTIRVCFGSPPRTKFDHDDYYDRED